MIFRQFQLGCLSLYSYLIGDQTTGRAVVVDPQRDVGLYLDAAARENLHIERIIETHVHADFVSGHLELAALTGAAVSYGDRAVTGFTVDPLAHGQRLELGEVVLEVRHTPGHTPESISVVIWDGPNTAGPWGVLTGDTLFIGDVGRPDLVVSAGSTADRLARDLYRSLHAQLMTLPDATRVFPAHGAGSACGKHLSEAGESTIGEQRTTNYALAPMGEDDFVVAVTEGQAAPPGYFAYAAGTNRGVHDLFDVHAPVPTLRVDDVLDAAANGAVLLDTRRAATFAAGHLRGSVNVGLDGRFAEYAAAVAAHGAPVVLIGEPGTEIEARTRLGRVGLDTVIGHLPDIGAVLHGYSHLASTAPRLAADELADWLERVPRPQLVDVRSAAEHDAGAIKGACSIPLTGLAQGLRRLNPDLPTVVYCAGGYRSSIAASLLRAHGFSQVADLLGGYQAWSLSDEGALPSPASRPPG